MKMVWRKVAGDARRYRVQLALMLGILVLGIAGVVAALNARAILEREIAVSYASGRAPDLSLWFDSADDALLTAVAAEDGVTAVDRRRVIYTRVAARGGAWLPMVLTIRNDFASLKLDVIHRHGEAWTHAEGGIFIEQSGESLLGPGPVQLRRLDGTTASLPFAGFAHDPTVAPSTQEQMFYGYATPEAARQLGYAVTLDQLLVKMDYRGSTGEAFEFGTQLNETLRKRGTAAFRVEVLPARHPHIFLMNAMLRVLEILSGIAFTCSAALAAYLASAWMRREVRIVGILKTLGARSRQIAAMYLALALPLLVIALALAFPLGIVLGRALAAWQAATTLNIDITSWAVPAALAWRELLIGASIPLVAMTLPILRAARMTARSAIQDAGIVAPSVTARLAARVLAFPGRMRWTLALRNTFRRPWRMLVMVIALGAGGALLLVTKTNYQSLMGAIDRSLANQGHDVDVLMQKPAPAAELEAIAAKVPGVAIVEAWRRATVTIAKPAAAGVEIEAARFTLQGYPPDSRLFKLPVVAGRAPAPGAIDEVLATRAVQTPHPQVQVDSEVRLRFRERETPVRIVGLVEQIGSPAVFAPSPAFENVTRLGDAASSVRVKSDGVPVTELANRLDQAFLDARRTPSQIVTRVQVRESLDEHFYVVGNLVRLVALAAALVGAIVLAATTAFNVLERSRETGILRALGALPSRITAIFLIEAGAILLASIALAVAVSLVISRKLLDSAERMLLRVEVPMQFSYEGLALLAAGALVIALVVHFTLSRALRKPAREALASE
ncbi:ABC transporter permease [Usitatibacter palustris]|uniref:ABC3 transporter permease C-terminal domain-containing protein n=1 Tax=Usitatibacter palustris TaxID=2732487 RepID=A0A6M4H3H7_9PROT|nr:ABC transporter permease [Usitatibacter palustris]QJR14076.1 hypothetical protein DSM104440_00869 [Usitatibacter palustris]